MYVVYNYITSLLYHQHIKQQRKRCTSYLIFVTTSSLLFLLFGCWCYRCSYQFQQNPGWRPGAISKRLLKMLNQAKNSHPEAKLAKPAKKSKRRIDDKPTLIICKRNGEYVVEMKVDAPDKNNACYPLVFKIAGADNEDKIRARARKQRRLINQAVGEVWTDPYNPDACHDVCYKVYKQAIGLDPFDPYDPECNCPEQELEETESCSCASMESDCSSLDVDWEIHFSPPSAFFQKDKEQEPEQNVMPGDDGSKAQIVILRNPKGLKTGTKKGRE